MKNLFYLVIVSLIGFIEIYANGNPKISKQGVKCDVTAASNVLWVEKCSNQIIRMFIKTIDTSCRNNAEFSEISNEALFKLLANNTDETLLVLSEIKDSTLLQFIAREIADPINDGIDVGKVVNNLSKLKSKYPIANMLLDSAKSAISKY
jgi:hypothetical protein